MTGVIGSALSALLGQSRSIATSANNVANLRTDGFKSEETRFISSNPSVGGGVQTSQFRNIDQQGFIRQTPSNLDLAINGDGFFVVEDSGGEQAFTRAGSFAPDANGDLRNANGSRLLGFNNGESQLGPINIEASGIAVSATTDIGFEGNLNAATDPASSGIDFSRNVTVFDSTGAQQTLTFEFESSGVNQFDLTIRGPGGNVLGNETLQFDTSGQLTNPANGEIELNGVDFGNGSAPQDITINLSGTTQFSGEFSVQNINQNGFGPGNLTRINIADNGVVSAQFSNGSSVDFAQVALAGFSNPVGLQPNGNSTFRETRSSGAANISFPGVGGLGELQPGSLEGANVSLSFETVNILESKVAFKAALATIRADEENAESLLDILS